ncbi:type II toxin-antitoxin system Phd/YefM family antitoxin [Mucilaginibacter sp. FT3.2]|uniref:type II toxin-antitoxin system Phd/YefM family antitoxin n=1 Tax=Mucilaginibacter sp. FT3.2 TaxID=2723090 RepID=UPI00160B6F10
MEKVSYSAFRQRLKPSLDRVRNNHEPLMVDCGNDENIVIISKEEYDNMEETFRRFKGPNNES